ncbi:hypothetical protein M569_02422, partial [Genlisea aurea]
SEGTSLSGLSVKLCEHCFEDCESNKKCCSKVHPFESPRGNVEPPSPTFSGEVFGVHSPNSRIRGSSNRSSSGHPSPVSDHCSPLCSDDDEAEDSSSNFFGILSEYFHDASDLDSSIVSSRDVFYSFVSSVSSSSHTTSQHGLRPGGVEQYVELEKARNSSFSKENTNCVAAVSQQGSRNLTMPCNFEANGLIWFPPPPEDVNHEIENNLFTHEDDDEAGDSGETYLRSSADMDIVVPAKDLDSEGPLKSLILGHFRALVSQLLQGQGMLTTKDSVSDSWVEVITSLSWQAAKYIRPDTSRGGSMDPCDYVKVKTVASGRPSESKLVKGIVCTKNIKHKRMMSQYKNARMLVLGGALEFQRVNNQLASVQTLLKQENDHVKSIVSKIEAHRPNVLLVEKSVSSCALEHLLAKEISLVLNIKRPLLEKIAKCSGASVVPSTDQISMARLGHCELFHLEKVTEDHESVNQFNKKPSKTLMYFEGCPRRLGCTIVLRGSTREELKKVKHVVHYAVFAAHHLSLETSFLVDEGATLPDMDSTKSNLILENMPISLKPADPDPTSLYDGVKLPSFKSGDLLLESGLQDSLSELGNNNHDYFSVPDELECDTHSGYPGFQNHLSEEPLSQGDVQMSDIEVHSPVKIDEAEGSSGEHFLANDGNQSILVSFSSHCMVNGNVCERSRLLRVKFYGPSDKPLGRYLRDDLFDQTFLCKSCNEPAEAHVICYTHQHANLTIKVRHLPTVKLPGERDGKIWMWHRCLRCELVEGVPPATGRVVMSDSAWGLSFGKFLELSFYNHVTGNRLATCGHSLQRDCLRFYGFGSMVASFQYSYIDILSVHLPPSVLEFCRAGEQSWARKEALELLGKAEALFVEISNVLEEFKIRSLSATNGFSDSNELQKLFDELNDMLVKEKNYCRDLRQKCSKETAPSDVLEINRLRRCFAVVSQLWDRRLYLLEALLSGSKVPNDPDVFSKDYTFDVVMESVERPSSPSLLRVASAGSTLSDRIDSAWLGVDQTNGYLDDHPRNPSVRRLMGTTRVYSFDSVQRVQERTTWKGLNSVRSFPGDYRPVEKTDPFLQNGHQDGGFVAVHDDEPTSMISYALCSKDYEDWIFCKPSGGGLLSKLNSDLSSWSSFNSSVDSDHVNYRSFVASDDQGGSPHLQLSFSEDESAGKSKFSVTCYFGREFDALRRKCCPSEADFIRSLSRCRKWCAQGGKSNVYFAKSLDERFIIKQVTKTELDSFEEFGSSYFRYAAESLDSRSPTCLAKVLGMYHVKGGTGKEAKKMDVMVMENLFFKRNISKVYDLKGSARSRYIPDAKGTDDGNKVLLDMNLMETLGRNPIFVGSRAKRSLERAVWNDTAFLASVDVMDYSLLVGVDEERKELVMGIIDFMRQYTWDKHLETWVKASGILGGPKNASPTIISPKQYKKRFRKAMTSYFRTVPDQWSS